MIEPPRDPPRNDGERARVNLAGGADRLVIGRGGSGAALARGSAWVAVGQVLTAISGMATSVLAARVLSPDDFGLMGIALLAIATLNALSQTGFDRALVQRTDIEGYVNTAWTVQVLRGALLASIILALARPLAWFYDEPALFGIFAVMSASMVATGFRNTATICFQRALDFRSVVLLNAARALVKLVVVVVMLYLMRNVWALVMGHVFEAVADLVLSYMMHPFRPRFEWNRKRARELVRFGKWITGMAILGLAVTRGDDMFVSKYLGLVALGLYTFAYELANLPATNVTHVVGQVSFATYSRLNDAGDLVELRRALFNVMKATMLITGPLSAFFFLGIDSIVAHVVGPQWEPIIPLVRILAIAGFIRSVAALATGLLHGAGKPHLDFIMNLPRFVLLAALIWPACAWRGIEGASWLALATISTCLPTWFYGLRTIAGVTLGDLLRVNALPFLTTVSLVVSYLLSEWLVPPDHLVLYIAQLLVCLLLWGATMWVLGKVTPYRIFDEIRGLQVALRKKNS